MGIVLIFFGVLEGLASCAQIWTNIYQNEALVMPYSSTGLVPAKSKKHKKIAKGYLEQTCKDAVCCDVLRENMHLLPQGDGRALDLACGMGGNAISLAQGSKLDVLAWDISSVAISKISSLGN